MKFFGSDLELLKEVADRAGAKLRGIDGAEDVSVEQVAGHQDPPTVSDTVLGITGPRREWDEAQDRAVRHPSSAAGLVLDRAVVRHRDRAGMTRKMRRRQTPECLPERV